MDDFDLLAGVVNASGSKSLISTEEKDSKRILLWQKLETNGHHPAAREGHSSAAYDDKVFVFGGIEAGKRVNSLLRLDLHKNSWSLVNCSGEAPLPRSFHTSVVVGRYLLVHGGEGLQQMSNTGVPPMMQDTHSLELLPSALLDNDPALPPKRSIPGKMTGVFPGDNIQGAKAGSSLKLQKAVSTPALPYLNSMITPINTGTIGTTMQSNHRIPSIPQSGSTVATTNCVLTCYDDFYACDLETYTWFRIPSSLQPLPRKGHTLNIARVNTAFGPVKQQPTAQQQQQQEEDCLIIFGGYNSDNVTVSNTLIVCPVASILRYCEGQSRKIQREKAKLQQLQEEERRQQLQQQQQSGNNLATSRYSSYKTEEERREEQEQLAIEEADLLASQRPIIWQSLPAKGKAPVGRYRHSATSAILTAAPDANSSSYTPSLLIIIGGLSHDHRIVFNDVHIFNCSTLTWQKNNKSLSLAADSSSSRPMTAGGGSGGKQAAGAGAMIMDGPRQGIYGHVAFLLPADPANTAANSQQLSASYTAGYSIAGGASQIVGGSHTSQSQMSLPHHHPAAYHPSQSHLQPSIGQPNQPLPNSDYIIIVGGSYHASSPRSHCYSLQGFFTYNYRLAIWRSKKFQHGYAYPSSRYNHSGAVAVSQTWSPQFLLHSDLTQQQMQQQPIAAGTMTITNKLTMSSHQPTRQIQQQQLASSQQVKSSLIIFGGMNATTVAQSQLNSTTTAAAAAMSDTWVLDGTFRAMGLEQFDNHSRRQVHQTIRRLDHQQPVDGIGQLMMSDDDGQQQQQQQQQVVSITFEEDDQPQQQQQGYSRQHVQVGEESIIVLDHQQPHQQSAHQQQQAQQQQQATMSRNYPMIIQSVNDLKYLKKSNKQSSSASNLLTANNNSYNNRLQQPASIRMPTTTTTTLARHHNHSSSSGPAALMMLDGGEIGEISAATAMSGLGGLGGLTEGEGGMLMLDENRTTTRPVGMYHNANNSNNNNRNYDSNNPQMMAMMVPEADDIEGAALIHKLKKERAITSLLLQEERQQSQRLLKQVQELTQQLYLQQQDALQMKLQYEMNIQELQEKMQETSQREEEERQVQQEAYELLLLHGIDSV